MNNYTGKALNKTYRLYFVILAAAFAAAVIASVLLGRYILSIREVVTMITGKLFNTGATWSVSAEKVLFEIRLPRVACAILIGAALSLAGVCYQGMFRNPMVSPDILGASTGAGFGASIAIILGAGYFVITLSAFTFGIAAVLLAYLTSRFGKTNETLALILGGMVISSLFSAGTTYLKLIADTQEQLPAITYWLMGSLTSIKVKDMLFVGIPVIAGMIPLFLLSWRLNLLTVEENTARSMGINIRLMRLIVIICATLLTSASVAVSGMIGWIGLVIPHFCRMIFGNDYRRLVPATVLFGATFLLVVDDVARIATTAEIPIGILTSFIGAPIFLYLLFTGGGRKHAQG